MAQPAQYALRGQAKAPHAPPAPRAPRAPRVTPASRSSERTARHGQFQGHFAWAPIGAAACLSSRRSGHTKRSKRFTLVRAAVSEISWEEDVVEKLPIPKGTPVKVVGDDVIFWHVPGSKGKPYNPKGLEGEVTSVIEDPHLTANRPILVKLTKAPGTEKFKAFNAHFERDEIEIITESRVAEEDVGEVQNVEATDSETSANLTHLKDDRWVINLLYDGDCPSCMKQVEFLQKRMDENPQYQGLVAFTNLHDPDYDPALCGGVIFEDGMRHIHAVTRDGEVIAGMDVFRRIYSIVGMQWVYEITTLPLVGEFFDWLYDWFSEYRLRAAGRDDILEKVHNHQAKIQELSATECDVECEVDWDHLDQAPKIATPRPAVAAARAD